MTVKQDPDVVVPSASAPTEDEVVVHGSMVQAVPVEQQQITTAQPQYNTTPPPPAATTPQQYPPAGHVQGHHAPVAMMNLGNDPKRITCPYCQNSCVTRTTHEIDACTIIAVVIMLIFGMWLLFWIPFVCNCCKTTNHYCSMCSRKVGSTPACSR